VIVLDASVLIGHFEPADIHHDAATAVLLGNARESFAANVVTLAEVYVGAARAGRVDQLRALIARLDVAELDLPGSAAVRLAQLRATTGLKMPDCCVLYSAEVHQAAITTFDERLTARACELGLAVRRASL
jgi:predicted nucleic acid-binding protein